MSHEHDWHPAQFVRFLDGNECIVWDAAALDPTEVSLVRAAFACPCGTYLAPSFTKGAAP